MLEYENRKLKTQKEIEARSEQFISESDWFMRHPAAKSVESVRWINGAVKSKSGRDLFTYELNQFRSKQVLFTLSLNLIVERELLYGLG